MDFVSYLFVLGLITLVIYKSIAERRTRDAHIKLQVESAELSQNLKHLQKIIDEQQEFLDEARIKNAEILSQKKSSETRLGMISEHLIPMLSHFPYNPADAHFLGQPVDYIIYDLPNEKIVFLEVKSGNSRLSKRQQKIKSLIEKGQVFYEEIRINEKGIRVKNSDDKM